MAMSRRSGKGNIAIVIIAAGLLGFAAIAMFTGERPIGAAARFMDALAKGDVEALTDLSNAPGYERAEIEAQWTRATKVAGPYFSFMYEVKSEAMQGSDKAVVLVLQTPEAGSVTAYERRVELPMTKTESGWKVDVLALHRDMYPGLPR